MIDRMFTRLVGLVLLVFSPPIALVAVVAFWKSKNPDDHGYFHLWWCLAAESADMVIHGEWL